MNTGNCWRCGQPLGTWSSSTCFYCERELASRVQARHVQYVDSERVRELRSETKRLVAMVRKAKVALGCVEATAK